MVMAMESVFLPTKTYTQRTEDEGSIVQLLFRISSIRLELVTFLRPFWTNSEKEKERISLSIQFRLFRRAVSTCARLRAVTVIITCRNLRYFAIRNATGHLSVPVGSLYKNFLLLFLLSLSNSMYSTRTWTDWVKQRKSRVRVSKMFSPSWPVRADPSRNHAIPHFLWFHYYPAGDMHEIGRASCRERV